MSTPFTLFEVFGEDLMVGTHHFDTDTFKVYLSNATPDTAGDELKADLAEISAGNGYIAGGNAVPTSISRTGGTTSVVVTDPSAFNASGGSIGPFRYAVIYNDTATGDPLIGYYDFGSSITISSGSSVGLDIDDSSNVLVQIS